jgi:hypothetical protein
MSIMPSSFREQARSVGVGNASSWRLGFVVYPTHRRVKVCSATRHLGERLDGYQAGAISFGELDASVKGWVNHVRDADTWGLRRHVLGRLRFGLRGVEPRTSDQRVSDQ